MDLPMSSDFWESPVEWSVTVFNFKSILEMMPHCKGPGQSNKKAGGPQPCISV